MISSTSSVNTTMSNDEIKISLDRTLNLLQWLLGGSWTVVITLVAGLVFIIRMSSTVESHSEDIKDLKQSVQVQNTNAVDSRITQIEMQRDIKDIKYEIDRK